MRVGKKIFLVLLAASFILSSSGSIFARSTITLRPLISRYLADFFTGKYWVEYKYDGKMGVDPIDKRVHFGIGTDLIVHAEDHDYTLLRTILEDEDFYCYQYTYEAAKYYAVGFSSISQQQRVICINLDNGVTVWKKDFPVHFDYGRRNQYEEYTNIILDDNRLYFQNNSWVIGVDKNTGDKVFESEGGVVTLESIHDDELIVNYCGNVGGIAKYSGKYKWVANKRYYPPWSFDGYKYGKGFLVTDDCIIDTNSGKITNRIDTRTQEFIAASADKFIIATSFETGYWIKYFNKLECYTFGDDEPVWSLKDVDFKMESRLFSCSTIVFFARLLVDSSRTGIYSADLTTNDLILIKQIDGKMDCHWAGTDATQRRSYILVSDEHNNIVSVFNSLTLVYEKELAYNLYVGYHEKMYAGLYIEYREDVKGCLDFNDRGSIEIRL